MDEAREVLEIDVQGAALAERSLGRLDGGSEVGGIEGTHLAVELSDRSGFAFVGGNEVAHERRELGEDFGKPEAGG
jgi:hypothetical protein